VVVIAKNNPMKHYPPVFKHGSGPFPIFGGLLPWKTRIQFMDFPPLAMEMMTPFWVLKKNGNLPSGYVKIAIELGHL
jgi:hypothetical protein